VLVADRRAPISTYRLQLTPDFGFAEVGALAGYLTNLGVTHVYLSPVLQAAPGSTHGYDVTDHSRISAALGGEEGFREMAARLRARGLGIILDIVPNHMAIPVPESLNQQLWSVLRDGPRSRYANWFDIDWAAGRNRMLLPILGAPLPESLRDFTVDRGGGPYGEPVLRYFDHMLPLRAGTFGLPLEELVEAQHYELAHWRDTAIKLNWRRFFDITALIGIRVEDPAVFNATHDVPLRLLAEGLVDGLRVDHPDGLADPRGYLRRLSRAAGDAWVVVEKILEAGERLSADWPCAGTTGYDTLRLADGLFIDPDGGDALTAEYARFARRSGGGADYGPELAGVATEFAGVALEAKRQVAAGTFGPEVSRLARLLRRLRPDVTVADARQVLTEFVAGFEVYRAYVYPGEPPAAQSVAAVGEAVSGARRRLPQRLGRLAETTGDMALDVDGPGWDFAARLQQTAGPVLAKGIEDTAFYRWPRLIALNEVGGAPDEFGIPVAEFHAEASRLARDWPATMTTLSTHDTKRQEDVRARLAVLAERPSAWGRMVEDWHMRAEKLGVGGVNRVDPATEYLLWQTLAGAWPLSTERLVGYLTKAMREAKTHTSWTDPHPDYEAAVGDLASRVLGDPELSASIASFVASISGDALVNSLGAKLVQLTMVGVADVYQGCELAGLSLVDPDNRRPVDFSRRRSLLDALDAGADADVDVDSDTCAAKLLVTSRTLRLRRDHQDWFTGGYAPLTATGPTAGHAVAFCRGGHAVTVATRLPAGLRRHGGWADTVLRLPAMESARAWRDVFTGASYEGELVPLFELTRRFPVALLAAET
jgi:(1->4)-alpha-D-glucan 1-alpha-D-glucosylmutase